jgi:hypothetical protein
MIHFTRHSHQAIEAQRAVIRAADDRVIELQAQWAFALRHRNEAQDNPKGIQRERYRFHKSRQRELEERAIPRAKSDANFARDILTLMLPEPHKPRRVRSTPTRYVRENGIRIPMRGN